MRPLHQRWLYALKPASWPKILIPALLGQVAGVIAGGGDPSVAGALVGLGFSVCLLVYLVLLNDWGDIEVDTLKRRMFSAGGSPKTIPDGILHAQSVWLAGVGAGLMAAAVALCGELALDREGLTLAGVGGITLFWAYTFPPLRMNYRGGGEFLEMLGVGVALPWFNAYAQGGEAAPEFLLLLLPGFALMSLASAVASGLSDEQSDRAGGKVTYTTEYGNLAARTAIENLSLAGALLWSLASRLASDPLVPIVVMPAVVVILLCWRQLVAQSASATTGRFAAIARYKQWLRRTIWLGTLALTLGLAVIGALELDPGTVLSGGGAWW